MLTVDVWNILQRNNELKFNVFNIELSSKVKRDENTYSLLSFLDIFRVYLTK